MPRIPSPAELPLLRQLKGDRFGRGAAVKSRASEELRARTATADRVVKSVCPYCAVGCAQNVFVKDEQVIQIEGDDDAPHSRGRLCPKGAATLQLTTGDSRERHVLYRRPGGADWERLDLATAMDMIVDRVVRDRRAGWQEETDEGLRTRRCMSIAALGGATLDNEENYLIKKLLTALGIVQIENQARVCHSSTVVGLGTSFGRGASSTLPGDLQNSDLIVLEGSNMAEAHPVAYQWVVEAKARGATVIHVDPHYSRTSALADMFVPLRAGTDIAFLGGVINHVLRTESDFREYVLAYTNAPTIVGEDFEEAGVDGLFSGYDHATMTYDAKQLAVRGRLRRRRLRPARPGEQHRHPRATATSAVPAAAASPTLDPTLQHPRCVWQILKRHYASYTPEMVERVCGVPQDVFAKVCRLFCENSGRERTASFVHGVGWTQHTIGSQYIRAASILQLLLGNMGRPGGGVMAMRGHASIQGSSDIPTLFDTLPGYIPMPHAHGDGGDLDAFVACRTPSGRLLGQHARLRRQPDEGLVGGGGDRRQRLLPSTTCRG